MAAFPSNIKPSITQGYGFGASSNVVTQAVQGGAPLQMLDYGVGPVDFNVGLVLTTATLQEFQEFYFDDIDSGADSFTMNLNSGNGIEQHTVMIIPESVNFNGDRAPIWTVSFSITAETTPFQENPFQGNLSDLFAVYGDGTQALLDQLEIFALQDLP